MPKLAATLLPIKTPLGTFAARYSADGLVALDFPKSRARSFKQAGRLTRDVRKWHAQTSRAVRAVLAGITPAELPPLDLSRGTNFQRRVWEELGWTPAGETRGYKDIARAIQRPNASRAVGGACGANPIPLLIPCHRVLAADGGIGGFSGGLKWKRRLLQIEGHRLQ